MLATGEISHLEVALDQGIGALVATPVQNGMPAQTGVRA